MTTPYTDPWEKAPHTTHNCPKGECYCPDGSEPRWCGHGPGGTCDTCNGCIDCDACSCGRD